eukprot:TRINITY_DN5035_c3_g1_i1.p1 TRINITY_DN5035_c3_g1~~TRINITY_DN5035_c3_g1_i1.p1  ORF type:complete len:463 (+),score=95.03 TRINITY_DN5035_c3_g1_i1:132-1391(+)
MTPTQLRNARKRAAKKTIQKDDQAKQVIKKKQEDPSLLYINDPLKAPTVIEAKKFFTRLDSLETKYKVNLGPLEGWRTSAKLAVRAGKSGPKIGLFVPKSHEICCVDGCPAHHPAINKALEEITAACKSVGVKGYDESSNTGDLRYLKLEVQRSSGKVQLTLVWHATDEDDAGPVLQKLLKALQKAAPLWYAVWANFNAANKHVNRIVNYDDSSWKRLDGKKKILREQLTKSGVPYEAPELCFPPFVFRQANICAFEDIVAAVRGFVPKKSKVVELYGGVGTIGLHLGDRVSSLVCSDENPHNKDCFESSLSSLPEKFRARLLYNKGDAAAQVESIPSADVVIVDPPRKGLDDIVLGALKKRSKDAKLKRLIYVSCGFPAFCRDADALLSAGWKATHGEGFVLFPGADHLETLCVFDRA